MNSKRPAVLVVDDEPAMRLAMARVLERAGFEVTRCHDGHSALDALTARPWDAMVSDVRMPGMNGLEAMARILDRDRRVPIVLNTAYDSYRDDFTSWAADAYVTKGADTEELLRVVRRLLEEREHLGPGEM